MMHRMRTYWGSSYMLMGMILSLILASCTPETEPQVNVPPSSTFEMENFDAWPTEDGNGGGRQETKIAYGLSALTVGVWQAFTSLTMALPVTAFKAALNQEPTYNQEMGAWHWSFTVGDPDTQGSQLICDLYGTPSADEVNWEMRLTKDDAFQEFVWYTGVSRLDETSGSWTIYRDPEGNSRAFLLVDWTRDADAGTGTIRYTNIDGTDEGNGNYIEAGRTAESDFDSYFTISSDRVLEIEWNQGSKAGRVRANGGDWSCWDENLDDVECAN